MLIHLFTYIVAVTLVVLLFSAYYNKRSRITLSTFAREDRTYKHSNGDNHFIRKSFLVLSRYKTFSCNGVEKGNYPCANFQKLRNITNAPLVFRTHYNILKRSRNGYVITDQIIHMSNKTQVYETINVTTFAYGFKDVIVSNVGTIHSDCWDICPMGACLCHITNKNSNNLNEKLIKYNKVIDIAHHWGIYVFHSIVECFTKLGYYMDELLKDESIIIHVPGNFIKKYFVFLGFNRSRLVKGYIYAKNLLTLERGPCGGSPSYLQVLSFRSYIRKKIMAINDVKHKYDVVLIKRNGVRSIINHDELLNTLQNIYGNNSVVVFNEDEKLVNVLTFFTFAKLIVAPHGAGLSHILFCDYNTVVLEFLSIPGMNGCYAGLSIKLGIKYYGLKYNTTNYNFDINITRIKPLLEEIKGIIYN